MRRFKIITRWVVGAFFASTILAVIAYRFIPVYITPLMVIRCFQDGSLTIHHHWISLDKMSAHMPVAVMASRPGRARRSVSVRTSSSSSAWAFAGMMPPDRVDWLHTKKI